jgi:hypothetical protein
MRHRPLLSLLVAAAGVAACTTTDNPTGDARPTTAALAAAGHGDHAKASDAPTQGQLQAAAVVRRMTARFADTLVSQAEGYTVQTPLGCAALPGVGGQGFHFLNPDLVDNHVNPMQPELVMYEPQADGSYVLVGVDYIIPFSEWTAPRPPQLFGQEFGRNEPLQVWALHIWTERANPNGIFAAWNPDVSCQYATAR